MCVYAVGLTPEAKLPVAQLCETIDQELRQFESTDSLSRSPAPPAACVLASFRSDPHSNETALARIHAHFHAAPVIGLIECGSLDTAVHLMQRGAFSVLGLVPAREQLLDTVTSAIRSCVTQRATFEAGCQATFQIQQATAKELEVLDLIIEGYKNREIAAQLGVTVRAVEDRRFRLMRKVGVDSVAELVALAMRAKFHEIHQSLAQQHLRAADHRAPCNSAC